jgi:hypothetical protein
VGGGYTRSRGNPPLVISNRPTLDGHQWLVDFDGDLSEPTTVYAVCMW